MSPIIASAGDSKTYTPAPVGVHQAVCVDVVDLGLLKVSYGGKDKEQHKIYIAWQIDETDPADGSRFVAFKRYTLSLHEKATLRKELEGWRGKPFSDDELVAFDVEKLIGVNCQINIQHKASNGKTYANIMSIMPLAKGMAKLEAKEYVRAKDRDKNVVTDEGAELTIDEIPF